MFGSIKNIFVEKLDIDIKDVLQKNSSKIKEFKLKIDERNDFEENRVFVIDGKNKTTINLTPLEITKILKTNLPKYIYGQEHVIEKIVNHFKNNLQKTSGPRASFLFLGASSTGKTYMSEMLAKLLKVYKYKLFDMALFVREDSGIGLYGSDFKFANSTTGELTEFVLNNPKSIIVFDEIEKANNTIQNGLLSIYNSGKLKDKNGWIIEDGKYVPFNANKSKNEYGYPTKPEITEVDFSETILIFTSNVGKELYNSHYFWDLVQNDYSQAENMIIQSLQKEIKISEGREVSAIIPSFLSRLSSGGLLLFKNLKFNELLKITKNIFYENMKLFELNYNLKVDGLIDFVYAIFLLSFAPKIDIRRLKSKVSGDFFDLVTDYIVDNDMDINIKREIKIVIDENVKTYFLKKLKPLMQEDIIKYMFRKNLTLKIDKTVEYQNNIFIYKIKNISLQKVKNVNDIGKNGIVFEVPDITFDDIAGHKKVKKRLKEIVTFMKNPNKMKKLQIDIPKGVLLYGPSGTGKTMLAKAVANEADLPFLATTGSDLLDLQKMDRIFDIARNYAPSIVFIDEFDTIGSREKSDGRDIFINKLLSKIDGFDVEEDIFIIAATNYPQNIDTALFRSGRIDIKVEINSLDKEARRYFIKKIVGEYKTKSNFDIDKLVLYTTGLNGSDLEKIRRECAIYMVKNNLKYLDQDILIEIINIVKYGEKIEDIDISHSLQSTAIHEAGHSVISKILKPEIKIEQISITPRDKALGFVSYNNEDGKYKKMTKEDLKKELQILLAGRYSQIKKYGNEGIDTGASDDLEKVGNLIYLAITTFGMDEEIGHLNISKIDVDFDIESRIKVWRKEAEENVKIMIDKHWDKIEKIANKLIIEENLDENELMKIIR